MRRPGNVVQPMLFVLGEPLGRPDKPLPPFALKNTIAMPKGARRIVRVPDVLGAPADRADRNGRRGHWALNTDVDVDGGVRREPLVLQYFDQLFPSMSMMIAAKSLSLTTADIKVQRGESVSLGRLKIGTGSRAADVYVLLQGSRRPARVQRRVVLTTSRAARSRSTNYADRIVLIGATARRASDASQVTPISPAMAPVLTLAHSVSSILPEHSLRRARVGALGGDAAVPAGRRVLVVLLPRACRRPGARDLGCDLPSL